MEAKKFWESVNNLIESERGRGAWDRGVKKCALLITSNMQERMEFDGVAPESLNESEAISVALNGARDWHHFSWAGSALISDFDICSALCTPSQIKRYKGGELQPNLDEKWLDVQARALYQAWDIVRRCMRSAKAKG